MSINAIPFYLRLLWTSSDGRKTIEVGKYKLSLSGLASAGFVQRKGRHACLRFVRLDESLIVFQSNDSRPALQVGRADF